MYTMFLNTGSDQIDNLLSHILKRWTWCVNVHFCSKMKSAYYLSSINIAQLTD